MKDKMRTNNSIEETVLKNILDNKCIENNDKILVAVSGGADSIFLLNMLLKLKEKFKENNIEYEISVAHVNHKLREESEHEKEYVENFCKNKDIDFYYLEKDVKIESVNNKMGIEEYARKVRYEFFQSVINNINYNKIAVAHNVNDNVETILLNIIRGSGLKGLCGMSYINNNIIRPLIDISKEDILKYCNDNKLEYYFDKTNEDDTYMRNKVRLNLIPILQKEYNKNFVENILRLRELVISDEEFLNNYTNKIVNESVIKKENDLSLFNFKNILDESESIKKRSIREIIYRVLNNVDGLENVHIVDILKLLEKNIPNKKYIIGNKFTIEIVKKYIAKIYCN